MYYYHMLSIQPSFPLFSLFVQLYAFQGSGSLTGPTDVAVPEGVPSAANTGQFDLTEKTDKTELTELAAAQDQSHLLDVNLRLVVPDINLYSHVLFNNK